MAPVVFTRLKTGNPSKMSGSFHTPTGKFQRRREGEVHGLQSVHRKTLMRAFEAKWGKNRRDGSLFLYGKSHKGNGVRFEKGEGKPSAGNQKGGVGGGVSWAAHLSLIFGSGFWGVGTGRVVRGIKGGNLVWGRGAKKEFRRA